MKKLDSALALLGSIILLTVAGCSDSTIDTAKLRGAFPHAMPAVQTNLDNAVTAINAGNFSAALPALQHVAYAAKMDADQRALVEDAIKKVKARMK